MATKTTTQKLDVRWQDRAWQPRIRQSFAEPETNGKTGKARRRPLRNDSGQLAGETAPVPLKRPSCRRPSNGWSVRSVLFKWRPRRQK